jgi:hypothetical protein
MAKFIALPVFGKGHTDPSKPLTAAKKIEILAKAAKYTLGTHETSKMRQIANLFRGRGEHGEQLSPSQVADTVRGMDYVFQEMLNSRLAILKSRFIALKLGTALDVRKMSELQILKAIEDKFGPESNEIMETVQALAHFANREGRMSRREAEEFVRGSGPESDDPLRSAARQLPDWNFRNGDGTTHDEIVQ